MDLLLLSQDNKKRMLLGILIIAFALTLTIRMMPLQYGFHLDEFDPYYNFRATEYLLEHGLDSYLNWDDSMTWYPHGRDISASSQTSLHSIAAIAYSLFGFNLSLNDFLVLFPAIVGAFTIVPLYAAVRYLTNKRIGAIAALFLAVSIPFLMRGSAGWFKSEPLGMFIGLSALALFVIGLHKGSAAIPSIVISAFLFVLAFGAWGGTQFFLIPIGIFILLVSFCHDKPKLILLKSLLFTFIVIFGATFIFERPGITFLTGFGAISLLVPTIVLLSNQIWKWLIGGQDKRYESILITIAVLTALSLVFIFIMPIEGNYQRYTSMLIPFMVLTDNVLIESVDEHRPANPFTILFHHTFLIILAAFGLVAHLKKKSKTYLDYFLLIFAASSIYIGLSSVRMELFVSMGLIIFGAIGAIDIFTSLKARTKDKKNSVIVAGIILFMLMTTNAFTFTTNPPAILTGASMIQEPNDVWLDSLSWLKDGTLPDAKVLAWWDYGYWITTMADRTTYMDNGTIQSHRIKELANVLLMEPNEGYEALKELDVDYVLVYIAGQKLEHGYKLYGGADESKIVWIARIAGLDEHEFTVDNHISVNGNFLRNTLMGSMFPYDIISEEGPVYTFNSLKEGPLAFTHGEIHFQEDDQMFHQVLIYNVP